MDDFNDDAKGGFRRIEVLTGPGRRRRWSDSEKARIVTETLAPGASVSEVARRWQLSPQQVFGWRRQARAGYFASPLQGTDVAAASFVPIVPDPADSSASVTEQQDAATRTEQTSRTALTPCIEIRLAGAVVRVTIGIDAALLSQVLRAVRSSAT